MKVFKKIILGVFVCVMLVSLVGCGKTKNVEGSLDEIMTKISSGLDDDMKSRLENVAITDDNIAHYLGTSDIEYKEGLAQEHITGSVAYSVVLLRAKENADIEAIKTTIKENVNPRRWICVWVEDEDVIIKNKGDLIILIMVSDEDNRNIIEKGFNSL